MRGVGGIRKSGNLFNDPRIYQTYKQTKFIHVKR